MLHLEYQGNLEDAPWAELDILPDRMGGESLGSDLSTCKVSLVIIATVLGTGVRGMRSRR